MKDNKVVSIDAYRNNRTNIEGLLSTGVMTEEFLNELQKMLLQKKNILVTGRKETGKTTIMNALLELLSDGVTIQAVEHENQRVKLSLGNKQILGDIDILDEYLADLFASSFESDYLFIDGFDWTDRNTHQTLAYGMDKWKAGVIISQSSDNPESAIKEMAESLQVTGLSSERVIEKLNSSFDYFIHVGKSKEVYYFIFGELVKVTEEGVVIEPNQKLKRYNLSRITLGGNGRMVETGRTDTSKQNQANKPKGETTMPLEVDTLQAGDVVRYYNFDGEFKMDEGVVNEDNIYKDGVEVHGDGWKQYVGKWFIDEVIRDNKTIFKKEAKDNE